MDRRSFFGAACCLSSILLFDVKPLFPADSLVKLVRYVDPSLVGGVFKVVGVITEPKNANEHYRNGEQLYQVEANGLILDVYADEIETM